MSTPLKSIRAKCLDCCSDQAQEVRLCPSQTCPLWPFRMGRNPNRAGIGGRNLSGDFPNSQSDFDDENANQEDRSRCQTGNSARV